MPRAFCAFMVRSQSAIGHLVERGEQHLGSVIHENIEMPIVAKDAIL